MMKIIITSVNIVKYVQPFYFNMLNQYKQIEYHLIRRFLGLSLPGKFFNIIAYAFCKFFPDPVRILDSFVLADNLHGHLLQIPSEY